MCPALEIAQNCLRSGVTSRACRRRLCNGPPPIRQPSSGKPGPQHCRPSQAIWPSPRGRASLVSFLHGRPVRQPEIRRPRSHRVSTPALIQAYCRSAQRMRSGAVVCPASRCGKSHAAALYEDARPGSKSLTPADQARLLRRRAFSDAVRQIPLSGCKWPRFCFPAIQSGTPIAAQTELIDVVEDRCLIDGTLVNSGIAAQTELIDVVEDRCLIDGTLVNSGCRLIR